MVPKAQLKVRGSFISMPVFESFQREESQKLLSLLAIISEWALSICELLDIQLQE